MTLSTPLRLIVEDDGDRLDRYLAAHTTVTRSQLQRLIDAGAVTVNERIAKASLKLEPGDVVEADLRAPVETDLVPQAMPLTSVYEDADLLVIDKPAGLAVHPGAGHPDHTLANAVIALIPTLRDAGDALRPGIVHRLDKDTSGLIVVAKHVAAQEYLARQFRERVTEKRYLALVEGRLVPERGAIEAPIGRDPGYRQRMAVVETGKDARTTYRVREYLPQHTLVDVGLETGRTHQIRVHFAAIDHAVTGDPVYGDALDWCARQFLHAWRLRFHRPSDDVVVEVTSELPEDLQQALEHARGLSVL